MAVRTLLPLVAALAFVAGFAVADLTGVRPLGGAVLLAGGAWCAVRARPIAGTARTALLLLVALAAFAASHPLGDEIGAWPSVVVMAALVAGAAALALGGVRSPSVDAGRTSITSGRADPAPRA